MPVTMPVGTSVFTIRIEYATDSDVAYNVLHYQLKAATVTSTGLPLATEPLASDVLPTAAGEVCAAFAAAWKEMSSNEVTITGATAQKTFPGDRSAPYHFALTTGGVGLVSSNTLPMQDSVTILKKTGIGERWGMGRVFIPGIPESLADKGFVSATYVSDVAGLADVIAADFTYTVGANAYTIRPVVTNVPTLLVPHVNDVIETELSNDIIKTQRRRRPGKGI